MWDLLTFPINILSIFGAADSLCGEAGLGVLAVVVDGGASGRWVRLMSLSCLWGHLEISHGGWILMIYYGIWLQLFDITVYYNSTV